MNGYKYENLLFKNIVDDFMDKYGEDISSIGLTKGDVAQTKQLDADYIPVDLNSGLFEVVDGVITLNLGALKNALDNYVDPSTIN